MTHKAKQVEGGALLSDEGGGGVSTKALQNGSESEILILLLCSAIRTLIMAFSGTFREQESGHYTTTNCDRLPGRGQKVGERGGGLARRRYQKGRVFLRGKKNPVWVGRWREDEIRDGQLRRIERSEVLGSKSDFPTKRLAQRELDKRLVVVNDPR